MVSASGGTTSFCVNDASSFSISDFCAGVRSRLPNSRLASLIFFRMSRNWLVADARGVIGVITRNDLEQAAQDGADKPVADLVNPIHFPHLHSDQGLDLALDRMGENKLEMLPVVNRANIHKLEGIVHLQDVLQAYGIHPIP